MWTAWGKVLSASINNVVCAFFSSHTVFFPCHSSQVTKGICHYTKAKNINENCLRRKHAWTTPAELICAIMQHLRDINVFSSNNKWCGHKFSFIIFIFIDFRLKQCTENTFNSIMMHIDFSLIPSVKYKYIRNVPS